MSNYTPVTNFTAKDAMPSGTAAKKVKGVDFDGEFNAISLMSTQKADIASPTFTGIVTAPIAALTTITAGSINATSLDLLDNQKIKLGTGDDLEIYHDGSNSRITDTGDGNLYITGSSNISLLSNASTYGVFGTSVDLYYNNSKKFETTNTGATISGAMNVTGALSADSILMADNKVVSLGSFGDFNMVHNGTDTVFTSGTGILKYTSDTAGSAATVFQIDNTNTDIVSGCFIEFKDSLGYTPPRVGALGPTLLTLVNGVTRTEVKATGLEVTGNVTATGNLEAVGITATGNVDMPDDAKVLLGDDDDLRLYHDGSDSYITDVGTGSLKLLTTQLHVKNPADDEFIIKGTADGGVDLYHNNAKKLETTAGGVDITGTATATTAFTAPSATFTALASSGLDVSGETETNTLVVDKAAGGILTEFKIGGSVCGAVRTLLSAGAKGLSVGSAGASLKFTPVFSSGKASVAPFNVTSAQFVNGSVDLGLSSAQWDDIYSVNAVTTSSDRNVKQSIEELTEAETRVAVVCKGLIRKFKWNSAVEKKGVDGARYHFGVIAQDLQAAFAAEGLDAGDYGLFISSTFTDDNGVEQTKLGVRYTELLAFIIGGLV